MDRPLEYRRYDRLDGAPSVIVDGAPAPGTVLTLSHWPGIPTIPGISADLSAQMAFAYLDAGRPLHGAATLVSNNHFDQDGLAGVYALSHPGEAVPRRELLVDVAAAGDFATYRDRAAARISMTIAAYSDMERSPLQLEQDYHDRCAQLYTELLGRLAELCDRPERSRELWAAEDGELRASEEAIARGAVRLEEVPELDLAVVTVARDAPGRGGHRFAHHWARGLHPMAINNATERSAVLQVRGRSYELTYRYEGWVQYRSRPIRPRVDLTPLADEFSGEEPGGARWVFDGPGHLAPRLRLEGAPESALEPAAFRDRLERYMAAAPPAWDPSAPRG
jgi:hypothetical protein